MRNISILACALLPLLTPTTFAQTKATAPVSSAASTALFAVKLVKNSSDTQLIRLSTPVGYPASSNSAKTITSRCSFKDLLGNKNELKFDVQDGFQVTLIPTSFQANELVTVVNVALDKFTGTGTTQTGGCSIPTGRSGHQGLYDVVKFKEGENKSFKLDNGDQVEIRLERLQQPKPVPQPLLP